MTLSPTTTRRYGPAHGDHSRNVTTIAATLALATSSDLAPPRGAAQTPEAIPSRPLRIVVADPAGGGADFVARTLAERLAKPLGHPVVIKNNAGASGALGAQEVAHAAADGHTL